MIKIKPGFWLLLFIVVLTFFPFILITLFPTAIFTNIQSGKKQTLTLSEAISVGLVEANKKLEEALLFDVTSVDFEESTPYDGANEERSMWNLTFADKKDHHPLYITIKYGEVIFF